MTHASPKMTCLPLPPLPPPDDSDAYPHRTRDSELSGLEACLAELQGLLQDVQIGANVSSNDQRSLLNAAKTRRKDAASQRCV